MLYTLRFFSPKCSLFHNANLFGSWIIHILYTGCSKIKKNNSGAKGLITKINIKKLIENLKTENKFLFAQISALKQLTLEFFSHLRFSTIHHVVIAEL